jgi:hypothetical protein
LPTGGGKSAQEKAMTVDLREAAMKPYTLARIVAKGRVEVLIREAGEQAVQREREAWLAALENMKAPEDSYLRAVRETAIRSLRRELGIKRSPDTIRSQWRERARRFRERHPRQE